MTFFKHTPARRLTCVVLIFGLVGISGCNRAAKREYRSLQTQLQKALEGHSYEEAVRIARRGLVLQPQDNRMWQELVQAQFGMHDLTGAKETLENWRRTAKKPPAVIDEFAGDLAFEEQQPAVALDLWSKLIAADPKNVRVLEKIARLEKSQRHWNKEDATRSARIAVEDNGVARINRALCRRRLHRWQEAFDDLQRARVLAPNDPDVERGGKLLDAIEKSLAEIRELNAGLAVSPDDPGLLADRALIFLRCGDYELALEDSEAAAQFGPWAIRPKLFAAVALIGLGRPEECGPLGVSTSIRFDALTPEFLETIARQDSEISAERNNAELYVERAWQLNEIGQPVLALQDAENAARLDPKLAGAFAEGSYALAKLDRVGEALDQIKQATAIDPNFFTAWEYRGELEMTRGETLSAIDSLTHAIDANPTATALQKREQCYRRLGLLVKAEQDLVAQEELNRGRK